MPRENGSLRTLQNPLLERGYSNPILNAIKSDIQEIIDTGRGNNRQAVSRRIAWAIFQGLAMALGSVSGIAWAKAAQDAAILIPDIQDFLFYFFTVGTIITIGSDGAWIMSEVSKLLQSKQTYENPNRTCLLKVLFPTVTTIFSLLSSTAPTYAIFKYNTGAQKNWAVAMLPVHLAYGLYGYSRLFTQILVLCRKRGNGNAAQYNNEMVRKLMRISNDQDTLNFEKNATTTPAQFVQLVKSTDIPERKPVQFFIIMAQIILSFALPSAASLVSIILTIEAYKGIWEQPVFYYLMTLASEAPNYVLGVVAIYGLFSTLINSITRVCCKIKSDTSIIRQIYATSLYLLLFVSIIVSLSAPSAGAYISYNELGNYSLFGGGNFTADEQKSHKKTRRVIQLAGTFSVIFSRLILAIFTMTRLEERSLTLYQRYSCCTKYNDNTRHLVRGKFVSELAERLRGTSPTLVQYAFEKIAVPD